MESIRVFAPATVANLTCGFDVLGVAMEKPGDIVTAYLSDKPSYVKIKSITGIGAENIPLDTTKNVAGVAVAALLKASKSDRGVVLSIEKNITPSSGIGSSAASSAAAVYAVQQLLNSKHSKADLVAFAGEGERCASGSFPR